MRQIWIAAALCLIPLPAAAQQGGGLAQLQAMDTNGDGSVTRAEAQAARATMFDRLDSNNDGSLSEAEIAVLNGRGRLERAVQDADANNDDRVTRDEMMGQPYRGFDWLDRNNDNVLSADEMAAAQNMRRSR